MDRLAERMIMFRFWNELDDAIFRRRSPKDSPIDRLLEKPWASSDLLVQQAWKAVTHPTNLKRLKSWLSSDMNPMALESTRMALAECQRRMKENPNEEPPPIPPLPECMQKAK